MNRLLSALSFLGLGALLSSCAPPLPPTWGAQVNNATNGHLSELYAACEGGLRLRLELGVTEIDSGLVQPGTIFGGGSGIPYEAEIGDRAEAEGWCFGAAAEELGYVRTAGRIAQPTNISQAGTTLLGVPLSDVAREDCVAGTESRGTPPCLMNDLF